MQHLDNNFKYWKGLDEMKLLSLRPPPECEKGHPEDEPGAGTGLGP